MSCEDNVPEVIVASEDGYLTVLSIYWNDDGVLCIDVCVPDELQGEPTNCVVLAGVI